MLGIENTNFRLHVTVLTIFGISLGGNTPPWYSTYSVIVLMILVYIATVLETYELYAYWGGDINMFANILGYQMTHFLGVAKVTTLLYYRSTLVRILKTLENDPFKPNENRGGPLESAILQKAIRNNNRQTLMYYAFAGMVLMSGISDAAVSRVKETPDKWHFPFVPFSLLDTSSSPIYEIVFLYQAIGVSLYALIISTTDCFVAAIMGILAAQLRIIQNSISTVYKQSETLQKSTKHSSSKTPMEISPNNYRCLQNCLRDSIKHHITLLEIADELEIVINKMVLVVFLGSVILLCFLLFQTSMTSVGSIEFMQSGSYCIVITFQIFLYCWWGNEVTLESENVAKSVAEVDFVGTPRNFQLSLIIMMCRSQKPLRFTAGKFSTLSVETYSAIIQGSFSYYMVLHRLNDPEA